MSSDIISRLKPNAVIKGDLFPELVKIITTYPIGNGIRIIGQGLTSNSVIDQIISEDKLPLIQFVTNDKLRYDGDSLKFRYVVEALRLGIAYEYDPYFSLSIARVDPLPHQLEAVYDYFLKIPRIRFLLADDPGAGKTIMAGLLIKELKIRGLIKRILIITPANLSFQWQRELKDKFRENFELVRGDVLRANYGSNPWQEKNQVITSVSWVSRIEDANESLLRSRWDLIIVDEAHKMSASDDEHKTLAYQLGEKLSDLTDHFLLMTATPHKGDPKNFSLFLRLLDRDVYADIKSLETAMENHEAPFYLRRIKEALVSFPDPNTGDVKSLFTRRTVQTIEFIIDSEEWDFYNELTNYVEDQSIKAATDNSARGRALGFTMAMLQRRFASSIYAVRRSLERMKQRREEILEDPEKYRIDQINRKIPDDFDDWTDEDQQSLMDKLEATVASFDPHELKKEIGKLTLLIEHARSLELKETESKVVKLKELLTSEGIFKDPKMKMLIFTEHKDTLDFLTGDGKDGRPLGKLREWGLSLTQIHGGMKIGDRNTPGTRIYAEKEFRDDCQIMVATEAAGEGINLQFCWLMINYDIPWNPVRLEQRMGRIHRYGQEKDCLIYNFVSKNTREGRVLSKLFERVKNIEDALDPKRTGKIFNVLGEIFPSNQLEKMLREMYSRNLTEDIIKDRIINEVDTEKFKQITNSTLEGLAKKELNLSAIVGKSAEAKERRLVPEVVEEFFLNTAQLHGLAPKETKQESHIFRIGRVPRNLWSRGEEIEPKYGRLGHEYKNVVFSQNLLKTDSTLEWITPGHPLFETVREETIEKYQDELKKGAIYYDLNFNEPVKLDLFSASIKDGKGNNLHRRLFVVQTSQDGKMELKQPTLFLDIIPGVLTQEIPEFSSSEESMEEFLVNVALNGYLQEISSEREREVNIIKQHMDISLNELIQKQNEKLASLYEQEQGTLELSNIKSNIKQAEDRVQILIDRLERRTDELAKEIQCSIRDIHHFGSAIVMPHPERLEPIISKMVGNSDIEKIAVKKVIEYEESLGYEVESVEKDNRGFDLISRKLHPEDPKTAIDVKFIEVKGCSTIHDIILTSNEYKTAQRLQKDYYLYTVFNCSGNAEINIVRDPATLGWEAVRFIERYQIAANLIKDARNN